MGTLDNRDPNTDLVYLYTNNSNSVPKCARNLDRVAQAAMEQTGQTGAKG
jgi:hypothetical protein